ncbi:MAG TPA: uroporphyrinogen decarboxylase family protein [Ruminiclostridium sp.]
MRNPDFTNILKVLRCEKPSRPTLFEFFLNDRLYKFLAGDDIYSMTDKLASYRMLIHAFKNAGYDYATVQGSNFSFPKGAKHAGKSISQNEGALITDRDSFKKYIWPDADSFDYSALLEIKQELPEGMKLIVWGPGGVLENVTELVGFENLCFMLYEDPELVQEIFDEVGSRLLRYYQICAPFDTVGALISNDDWGYNSQTMLKPSDMRKYVFPWHKKIVETIHASGKPAILHSCGNLNEVMDDIIDDMKYDGKHSYQDKIIPVEEAYEKWGARIAILGGIDVDFVCTSSDTAITKRCVEMIERSSSRGGYALGTGNSVPEYVPDEKYFAMIKAIEV